MNTTKNVCTIQLQNSAENTSAHNVSSTDWLHFKDSSYNTIKELKKIKFSVYKERLNLYEHKCRSKDDVILALKTCLDTYKYINLNNDELITFLKSKLTERRNIMESVKNEYQNQIVSFENIVKEKNEQIVAQNTIINDKNNRIAELEEKLRTTAETNMEESVLKTLSLKKMAYQNELLETDVAINSKVFEKLNDDFKESVKKIELCHTIDELQKNLETTVVKISQPQIGPFKTVFENSIPGTGWIVIQRRIANIIDFNQGWHNYVDGFGDLKEDFWIGLDKLHALTNNQAHELYIHLVFKNNITRYAHYDNFTISGKKYDYKLQAIGKYCGNAGDGLRSHVQKKFTTIRYETTNSVEYNRWWQCRNPTCNLNGAFEEKSELGVWWCGRKDNYHFLDSVQMLIRPKQI